MKRTLSLVLIFCVACLPNHSLAIQEHGAVEGDLVHQGAHILFFWAMCDFCYRIIKTQLFAPLSRKYLFGGSFLLCLWNLWAFAGHIIESRFSRSPFIHRTGDILGGQCRVDSILEFIYYFLKMDSILLVPAILLFFLASRQIVRELLAK